MKIYWKWFVGLLAFEFLFALSVHGPVLTSHPWLNVFVHAAERIAPVIGRFDSVAKDPEAVRTFLALTVMLLPLHVAFFFIWLNSSFTAIYRHLVISPRTKQSARDVGSFVTAPLDDEDTPQAGRERSLLSRILWSGAILLFAATMYMSFFWWLGENISRGGSSGLSSIDRKLRAIAAGGIAMWISWSVYLNFCACLIAVALCVVRDYAQTLIELCKRWSGK